MWRDIIYLVPNLHFSVAPCSSYSWLSDDINTKIFQNTQNHWFSSEVLSLCFDFIPPINSFFGIDFQGPPEFPNTGP